jgi:hypothetical protein
MEEREGKGQGVVQMIVGRMRAVKLLDRVDRTFFQPSHCTTTLTARQKILGVLIIGIRCHGSTAGARAGGRHLQVDALMGWGCRGRRNSYCAAGRRPPPVPPRTMLITDELYSTMQL